MSLARVVFWNTFVQIGGRFLATLLGLVVFAIMTRALGPDGFGSYTIIMAYLQFFGIIIDFGFTLTANRLLGEAGSGDSAVARDRESRLMSNLMTMRFFSALVFFGIAPLIALFFFPYSLLVKLGIFLAVLSFLAIAMIQTLTPIFQKHLRMGKVALAELAGRGVLLAGVILCAYLRLGLFWFIGAIIAGNVFNYFLLRFYSRPFVRLKWSFDFGVWRQIIVLSWPIGISVIFNLVYLRADTILLSIFRPSVEVGFYGAAYRVLDILTGMASMFMGLVMPLMSAAWIANDQLRFKRLFQRAFDAMTFIALPVVLLGIMLGRPLMALVAGRDFMFSGDILAVLIIGMGAVFYSTLFGYMVVVIDRQKIMIWGYALDALLSIIGYLIFIPRYGVWGAAWVTVFSEIVIVALTGLAVLRATHSRPNFTVFSKTALAILLAAAVVVLLKPFNWILAGFSGLFIYGGIILLTKAISREMVKDILSFRRS